MQTLWNDNSRGVKMKGYLLSLIFVLVIYEFWGVTNLTGILWLFVKVIFWMADYIHKSIMCVKAEFKHTK